jgi:hypothetical protein
MPDKFTEHRFKKSLPISGWLRVVMHLYAVKSKHPYLSPMS